MLALPLARIRRNTQDARLGMAEAVARTIQSWRSSRRGMLNRRAKTCWLCSRRALTSKGDSRGGEAGKHSVSWRGVNLNSRRGQLRESIVWRGLDLDCMAGHTRGERHTQTPTTRDTLISMERCSKKLLSKEVETVEISTKKCREGETEREREREGRNREIQSRRERARYHQR